MAEHFLANCLQQKDLKLSIMKLLVLHFSILSLLQSTIWAFVPQHAFGRGVVVATTSLPMAAVELKPEPDGGLEMTPSSSMAGCRMKQMEEMPNIKNEEGTVYHFWMTGEADGALVKEIRTQILKDASKKANFPGFRKGQVPPYAQPQITQFAVQEAIIKTVEAAVDAFNLKPISGSDGELEVHEDVIEMSKGYKTGTSLPFTASFNAIYDSEKQKAPEEVVLDAAVEQVIEDAVIVEEVSAAVADES